jgi:hypothetical protein
MRFAMPIIAASVVALSAPVAAQSERVSLGIAFGTTSDFDRGQNGVASAHSRHWSVGVPVRIRLVGTGRLSIAALGAAEWSYAPSTVRADGLSQLAAGPELQSRWHTVDVRLAGLLGSIRRRNDWVDESSHREYGLETGAGFHRGPWRFGYTYRHAWVEDVPRIGPACPQGTGCRWVVILEPPTTETYNRHALSISWQR